jgi:hypothetical protein
MRRGPHGRKRQHDNFKPVDGERCVRGLDLWGDSGNWRLAAPDLTGEYPELFLE